MKKFQNDCSKKKSVEGANWDVVRRKETGVFFRDVFSFLRRKPFVYRPSSRLEMLVVTVREKLAKTKEKLPRTKDMGDSL